ncbi:S-layer homology domain-containing protein [Agathobaculum sp. NTUH-O15-33]|uniref:S-layer homology domain-containing protein n=1 Tax=Agathobaculum sp. NTUH-O15-33 TaxID=3079302 RepID=UPI0029587E37|nr:S-layer homology domain-containing protein [Agathobaculum sp. NTUH-O15-33]WNX86182.1 S-layer homology domain-containing protein [Agathobaculum sp. NTUH-O15-33]
MRNTLKKAVSWLLTAVMLAACLPAGFAAEGAAFKNGPYLMAPKTDSMVVVWEATQKTEATIAYGTEENALCEPIPVQPRADAPDFQGAKMQLYQYRLENLKPGARYYYEVKLAGGESCKANFKTLENDPEKINLISLSDSHAFATRAELDAAVKQYDPAFLLHCGDIVEGTGAQAEQFSYFLKGEAADDFIHYYPVVYSSGNHDQGGVYYNTYIYDVQDKEYGAVVNGDSSFDYGGLHITLMNSAPWGLYQMNSEATGQKADAATIDTISKAMDWLRGDLASDAAKNADFRIITMHHPVSDAYTKRYIPDVIEPGKVDLLLSGHTHSYARAVSANPAVGASTVYLTHQDARTYNKKGDYFHITGDGDTLTVDVFGAESAGAESKLAVSTTIAKEKQVLGYSDVSLTPNEVLYNGFVTVKATVTNNGKGLAAAVLPVTDNGETRYLYQFDGETKTLDPGASVTLTGTLSMGTLGKHTLKLADKSVDVNVKFRAATFDYRNIRTKMGDGEMSDIESNTLHIKADVTNIGNEAGTATAEFKIDGETVETKQYNLGSDETKTAEFSHTFEKAGAYEVTIGNAAPQTVYIEGSIQGMPIVKDKSGSGNNGYIHGQPELGTDDQGRQTLILDGKRDYIEIPDNGGYTVKDACTGVVWANLPGAGTTKPGVSELTEQYIDLDGKGAIPDHNPLMVKGIGLGWGTPYLFRMAVRENGKVTYGVCLLDDNGEFSWNDDSTEKSGIQKDTWVQYTSAFDFETGGDAYENDYNSSHVDKPPFTAPVKNWEGEPMYIGLGFKNTLQTGRGRGMYHTMLPGAIAQVRFYTDKLSAAENDTLRAAPTAAGPKADALKIWLSFEDSDLNLSGTHTTEWVTATAAPSALAYDVSFGGKASVTATVQTSDDGKTIKEEKNYPLENGANTAALTGLGQAKYVRVKTAFVSDLNKTESSVPVLTEYTLTAGSSKTWNTLVDWSKGTFEGAAGHQSGDVYRNHAKDFDDYGETADQADVSGFADTANHWAKNAIEQVVEEGLFTGASATAFEPENTMTRGMFVTVLGRMAGAKGDGAAAAAVFSDVPADAYYAPFVAWASENGIVTGTDPGRFSPGEPVSREQMAALLSRYADYAALPLGGDAERQVFADDASIRAFARDAVYRMQQSGVILGQPGNVFEPQGNATRAEAATMLCRFEKLTENAA